MRTVFALGLAISIASFVAGCTTAQVTQPVRVGADTYRVSSRTSSGGTGPARDAAVSAARQQCAQLSKQLLVVSSSTNIGSNEDQGVVDVTFRCLAAGDPGLQKSKSSTPG
jgi:hypothetical protein